MTTEENGFIRLLLGIIKEQEKEIAILKKQLRTKKRLSTKKGKRQ